MRRLLLPLLVLAATAIGCGVADDDVESTDASTNGDEVGVATEGLQVLAPPPFAGKSPGKAGEPSDESRPPNGAEGASSPAPNKPGGDRFEPVPVPWDTPRVKSASDA